MRRTTPLWALATLLTPCIAAAAPHARVDTDGDGLDDLDEFLIYYTNPNDPDTDHDGLNDFEEVFTYPTNPNDPDTDHDGLNDYDEVLVYPTDPLDPDSDADGLADGEEINTWSTDPLDPDSDDDQLTDHQEVMQTGTDPNNADSDGNGLGDYQDDTDSDGLSNGDEANTHGTDPALADTDDDGLNDGDEILTWFSDPFDPDTDDDGFHDGVEAAFPGADPIGVNLIELVLSGPTTSNHGVAEALDGPTFRAHIVLDPTTPSVPSVRIAEFILATESVTVDGLRGIPHPQERSDLIIFDRYAPTSYESLYYGLGFTCRGQEYEVEIFVPLPLYFIQGNDPLVTEVARITSQTLLNPLLTSIQVTHSETATASITSWDARPFVDTDDDGVSDSTESTDYGTDPAAADTDADGLSDTEERFEHQTNPLLADTDGGGVNDGQEILDGTDPLNPADDLVPCPADTNGDGFLDNGDIGTFIDLYLAGDPAADMNGDGFLDNGDIGTFINAFLAGC